MANSSLPNFSNADWKKLMDEGIMDRPLFRELMMKEVNPALGYVPPSRDSGGSYAAGANTHTHTLSGATQANKPTRWSENVLANMLASRFAWGIDSKCPFQRVLPYRVTDDKIVVFVVTKIDAILLYDDAYLYPSDALVSQIRLLMEAL